MIPYKKDPQMVLPATVKQSERSEVIVFSIPLGLFELCCIVPIPSEDSDKTTAYVKFKVNAPRKPASQSKRSTREPIIEYQGGDVP